jgi:hypothetical protein
MNRFEQEEINVYKLLHQAAQSHNESANSEVLTLHLNKLLKDK